MKKIIHKLAIANRGEVAVRIHNAARELGIKTVLLHSEVDTNSKAYRTCDESVCIGPAPAAESYLHMERVINGALSAGAQAIHPGFGFLSENAEFAQKCASAGLIFVGPSPQSIDAVGDKISARHVAQKAGVPVVPGYDGEDQSEETLLSEAKKIGFPVIIKATSGGGGRGLKISKSEKDFLEQLLSARREAGAAFKNEKVFLEKYLDKAKHIEIQIFGDASGEIYHLYDRECSVQRRHQKIIEEATAATLPESVRISMAKDACLLAKEVKYQSAGTVEFIYQDKKYYFMEMNTRLQVEHPVSECVTGLDLVKAQLLNAMGESVHWNQSQIIARGHSIECRIYAENPFLGGIPSTGILGSVYFPERSGCRYEVGFEKGDEITSFYDSMIAKVIVWDENRARAIAKTIQTLKDSVIFGLHTNIPYLIEILNHPEFREGTMTTQFIGTYFSDPLTPHLLTEEEKAFAFYCSQKNSNSSNVTNNSGSEIRPTPFQSYWRGV